MPALIFTSVVYMLKNIVWLLTVILSSERTGTYNDRNTCIVFCDQFRSSLLQIIGYLSMLHIKTVILQLFSGIQHLCAKETERICLTDIDGETPTQQGCNDPHQPSSSSQFNYFLPRKFYLSQLQIYAHDDCLQNNDTTNASLTFSDFIMRKKQ